jgi:DNA-binding protein
VNEIVGHICEQLGEAATGYRAVHCAAVNDFTNSAGEVAVRGRGQAICQRVSDNAIVQCAGILQRIAIVDFNTGRRSVERNFRCGRYVNHNPPCPAERFQNMGEGMSILCPVGGDFFASVITTIILPVSGETRPTEVEFLSGLARRPC